LEVRWSRGVKRNSVEKWKKNACGEMGERRKNKDTPVGKKYFGGPRSDKNKKKKNNTQEKKLMTQKTLKGGKTKERARQN